MASTPQETQIPKGPVSKQAASPFSLKIATLSGIPIRLHITFVLLIAWIAATDRNDNYAALLFIVILFVCVLLHELGHALTARHYGIETFDITLYPIGGIATIDGQPKPKAELWIAFAGPLVNLVIAVAIAIGILIRSHSFPQYLWVIRPQSDFMGSMFAANLMLAAFNLIPAIPMDGGRVLRSLLSIKFGNKKGTQVAGMVGQFIAICLIIIGLVTYSLILVLIAAFVLVGASQEIASENVHSITDGHQVSDAMITNLKTLEPGATLDFAAKSLLDGSQHDFPVVLGGTVHGILTRSAIIKGLAQDTNDAYISGLMIRDFPQISSEMPLDQAIQLLRQQHHVPILVIDNEELKGMLTYENLSEFVMLANARASHHN